MAKRISVGKVLLGAAVAVAGLATYVYYNEELRSQVEGAVNREKAKLYIRAKLNGSDKLMSAVDGLSDEEINTLMKVLNEPTQSVVTDTVNEVAEHAKSMKDKVVNYFDK